MATDRGLPGREIPATQRPGSYRPVTHGRILRIALPIVISNATIPILGAVDTAVVGQLGQAAPIGAVGIGAVILSTLYWLFGFLRMGTVGLASQALGAGDEGEFRALLTRSLMIGAAAGVVLITLQVPVFHLAFLLSPASAEVEAMARDYVQIRIWSAPAAIAIYGLTGWLIAQERTGAVLVLQVAMNGANVALDVWFVLGLDWGVPGVALATFLAEWGALGLGLWLCRDGFRGTAWRDWPRVLARAPLVRMARVNTDILLRSLMLMAMFSSFLMLGGRFGDVTLAANQVLLQFLYISAYAMDGFAFSAETLVGQALGGRRRADLRRSAVMSALWAIAIGAVLSLGFWLFGGLLIDTMATAPEVRHEARTFLVYIVLAPSLGVAAWMLDGVFIGATRSRDMRDMMAVSFVIYLASLAALIPLMGNHGLWMALLISFVARGLTLGIRYPSLEAEAAR